MPDAYCWRILPGVQRDGTRSIRLYREYVLTVAQIVERFGLEAIAVRTVRGLYGIRAARQGNKRLPRRSSQMTTGRLRYRASRAESSGRSSGSGDKSRRWCWSSRATHEQPFCAPQVACYRKRLLRQVPGMECLGASKMLQTLEKPDRPGDRQGAESSDGGRCIDEKRAGKFASRRGHLCCQPCRKRV